MSSVADFTNINFIKQIESKNKFIAIEELASVFKESTICSDLNALVKALKEREEIMSTGIGMGIAIPHAKIGSTKSTISKNKRPTLSTLYGKSLLIITSPDSSLIIVTKTL